jgi:hypothetical protein
MTPGQRVGRELVLIRMQLRSECCDLGVDFTHLGEQGPKAVLFGSVRYVSNPVRERHSVELVTDHGGRSRSVVALAIIGASEVPLELQ